MSDTYEAFYNGKRLNPNRGLPTMSYAQAEACGLTDSDRLWCCTDGDGTVITADQVPYDSNNSVKDKIDDIAKNVVTVTGNPTYVNSTEKYIYYVKLGRMVIFSGRFSVTTEKPAGQSTYLFEGLPEPISITSINETTLNSMILTGYNNQGYITSNFAIGVGNYNVFGAYIAKQ